MKIRNWTVRTVLAPGLAILIMAFALADFATAAQQKQRQITLQRPKPVASAPVATRAKPAMPPRTATQCPKGSNNCKVVAPGSKAPASVAPVKPQPKITTPAVVRQKEPAVIRQKDKVEQIQRGAPIARDPSATRKALDAARAGNDGSETAPSGGKAGTGTRSPADSAADAARHGAEQAGNAAVLPVNVLRDVNQGAKKIEAEVNKDGLRVTTENPKSGETRTYRVDAPPPSARNAAENAANQAGSAGQNAANQAARGRSSR